MNLSIYLKWFETFQKDVPIDKYIYLKTTPKIANERIHIRSREGETIPLEYLQTCNDYHDEWLNKIPQNNILVFDANEKLDETNLLYNKWNIQLRQFIN